MNILLHSYAGNSDSTKRILSLNANIYFSFALTASKVRKLEIFLFTLIKNKKKGILSEKKEGDIYLFLP